MNKANQPIELPFIGGLDQDTDLHEIEPGNYTDALNVEPIPGSKGQARRIIWGNTEIDTSSLTMTNPSAKGAVEDPNGEYFVYFLNDANVSTDNQIVWYDGDELLVLLQNAAFENSERVHSAVLVNDYLYWTDGIIDRGFFEGQRPFKLNVQKHRPDKAIQYELVLGEDSYTVGAQIYYQLLDRDGSPIAAPSILYTVQVGDGRDDVMAGIAAGFTSFGFTVETIPLNTADDPVKRLKVTAGDNLSRIGIIWAGGIPNPSGRFTELNFYPVGIDVEMLSLIKPCPQCAPTVNYLRESSPENYLNTDSAYQFRYRYIFDDGEKSAWGPASIVPTNYRELVEDEFAYESDERYNAIEILIDDPRLENDDWFVYIRKIEVAYRNSFDDVWRSIDTYDLYNFDWGNILITWYGKGNNVPVPSDEDGAENVQALKNYDFVPRGACSLELIQDESGNSILAIGGGLYDYNIEPLRATIDLIESDLPTSDDGDFTSPDGPPQRQTSYAKAMKRGGVYKVGVALKDWAGRQTAVIPVGQISIPYADGKVGEATYKQGKQYHLDVDIFGTVYSVFPYYNIVVTENLNQQSWWRFDSAQTAPNYTRFNHETSELEEVANEADADYIEFISYYGGEENLTDTELFHGFGAQAGFFTAQKGDRIQIMSWVDNVGPANAPDHADRETYNYRVAGYRIGVDSVGNYIGVQVELNDNMPNWRLGSTLVSFEIYRVKQDTNDQVYYEFGPCGTVTTGYDKIDLEGYGDVFASSRRKAALNNNLAPIRIGPINEYTDLALTNTKKTPDFGRAVPVDPEYQERFNTSMVRVSDILVPQSSINGLSSFRSTNFININQEWGPIYRLVMNQSVLLAIAAYKTQPIYVAKDRLLSLDGSTQVGRTNQLLNLANELRYDFGTINPESVVYYQGATYGFDALKGVFWRYSTGNGQQDIGRLGLKQFWIEQGEIPRTKDRILCISGWDRRTDTMYVNSNGTTVMFKEEDPGPRWTGFSSDEPEVFVSLNNSFYTIENDKLFVRDEEANRAEYDGTQYDAYITLPFNQPRHVMKLPNVFEFHASGQWHMGDLIVPANKNYPSGQRTSTKPAEVKYYEGAGKGPIKRDQLDPDPKFDGLSDELIRKINDGRPIRCEAAEIKFQADDPSLANVIRNVYIYFNLSKQTVQ